MCRFARDRVISFVYVVNRLHGKQKAVHILQTKNKIGQSFTQIVPGFIAYGNGVKEDRIIGEREIIYGRINSVPSTKMYCELFAFSVLHVYIPVWKCLVKLMVKVDLKNNRPSNSRKDITLELLQVEISFYSRRNDKWLINIDGMTKTLLSHLCFRIKHWWTGELNWINAAAGYWDCFTSRNDSLANGRHSSYFKNG